MEAPSIWNIGLSAWIIQDGNYPDFVVGQSAEFAVEYFVKPNAGIRNSDAPISARYIDDSTYDVVAKPILRTPELSVLDIGIFAYCESPDSLENHRLDQHLATTLNLGVEPFSYFETFAKNPSVPPLIYSWRILSILRQTAPWLEKKKDSGGSIRVRDQTKLQYVEINKTDAWSDDDGHGEYVLRCELLPVAPKRTSATAT